MYTSQWRSGLTLFENWNIFTFFRFLKKLISVEKYEKIVIIEKS